MEEKRHISKEDKKRIRELKRKIKAGSSNAKLELAKIYFDMPPGIYDKLLLKMLYELADEGNTDAMLYLARIWGKREISLFMGIIPLHNFFVRYEGYDNYISFNCEVIRFGILLLAIPFLYFPFPIELYFEESLSSKWFISAIKNGAVLNKEDLDLVLKRLDAALMDMDHNYKNKEDNPSRMYITEELLLLYELSNNGNTYAQVILFDTFYNLRHYGHCSTRVDRYLNFLQMKVSYSNASPNDFIELKYIREAIENDTEDIGAISKYAHFLRNPIYFGKYSKEWFLYFNFEIIHIFASLKNSNTKFSNEYVHGFLQDLNSCYSSLDYHLYDVDLSEENIKQLIEKIDEYFDYLIVMKEFVLYYKNLLRFLSHYDIPHELKYECHLKELLISLFGNSSQQLIGLDQQFRNLITNGDALVDLTMKYMSNYDVYTNNISLPYDIAQDIAIESINACDSGKYFDYDLLETPDKIYEMCEYYFKSIIGKDYYDNSHPASKYLLELYRSEAHFGLAEMYKYGRGVKADFEKAKYHFIEYSKILQRSVNNQLGLLCNFFNKHDEAIVYYRKALNEIDNDNKLKAIIEYNIGYAYIDKNKAYENAENVEKALKWFKLSNADGCTDAVEAIMMIADGTPNRIRSLEDANSQILTQYTQKMQLKAENERMKKENQFWKDNVVSGMEDLKKRADEIIDTTHRTEEKIDHFTNIVIESNKVMAKSIADLSAEIGDMHGNLEDIDNKIDEEFEKLSQKFILDADEDMKGKAEEKLKQSVNPIYDQLIDASKEGLIAAELIYHTLQGLEITFSGVIVHLCASLEQQIKYVFWHTYKNFCRSTYGDKEDDLHKWPSKLTYPKNQKEPDNLSESEQFMLGDLYMYCHPDKITRTPHNSKENKKKNLRIFRAFLKAILKNEFYNDKKANPEMALDVLVKRVESIREFRNESAHGNTMSKEQAEKCYDLILGKDGEKTVFNLIYDVVDAQKVNDINDQKGKR